jgi:ABC-type branched-subunit amino acid transport system substrate-binding protein
MQKLLTAALAASVISGLPYSAQAEDGYRIGITAALTGAAASSQGPIIEALRVYIDRVNAQGGVNGHPIEILLEDDQGDASRAAANVTKLLNENIILLGNSSLSNTFPPVVAEAKAANMPIWYVGAVCPKETLPPADPLQFCSTGYAVHFDSLTAMTYIHDATKTPQKLGMVGLASPLARTELVFAAGEAPKLDLTPVDTEIVPGAAPDFTPYATKLEAAKPDWVFGYGTWNIYVKTFEALRQLGWNGSFICYSNAPAEEELGRMKDPGFYIFAANALFRDDTPAHRDELKALQGKMNYPATQGAEGWIEGMVLEAALRKVSWPPSPQKVQAAMSDLTVDMKGLRGGPLVWTKDNHFRTRQSYRVYHWDKDKGAIEPVSDWIGFDVK